MQILKALEKSKNFWFLLITTLFFFILRFPSMFEPYWYGDEGIYQVLGLGINSGRLLYRDVFDNKPPFLYLLYSLFNSDQFLLRAVSLIFGILSVWAFYFLSKKLFTEKIQTYISTSVFALLFSLPLIEGNIANAENFMLLFNISAAYLAVKSIDATKYKFRFLFFAGVLLSISFLFKIVALFDFAAICMFLIFLNSTYRLKDLFKIQNIKNELINLYPLILGFAILPLLVAFYFFAVGAFPYFLKATLLNNVGYVNYGNKFIIPQGLLILKLSIILLMSAYFFIKRKALGNTNIFIYLWVMLSLFSAFFSQRPYTHYVLVTLPAICLLVGSVFAKSRLVKFNLIILIVSSILLYKNFGYYSKTIPYYPNFIQFMLGQKSVASYQRFFDGNTPNDYQLAAFLNMNLKKNDNIFIWGNNAQVYKMTNTLPPGRYSVAYHITSYNDGMENTIQGLNKSNPKFVIIMGNVRPYPFGLTKYENVLNINGINIYERIIK